MQEEGGVGHTKHLDQLMRKKFFYTFPVIHDNCCLLLHITVQYARKRVSGSHKTFGSAHEKIVLNHFPTIHDNCCLLSHLTVQYVRRMVSVPHKSGSLDQTMKK